MTLLETILVTFSGSALLIGAIAWIARSIAGQFLARDIERFKSELAAASNLAAERTKHELQLAAQERGVLFAKLNDKRAEVIAELYGLLVETQWASHDFASPMEVTGQPSKPEKYATALNKSTDFFRFFDKNRIYLPHELCEQLDEFLKKMRAKVIGFGVYLYREEEHMSDDAIRKKHEAWIEASRYFDDEVPKAREALETELRQLIGAADRSHAK
jgi:hypothetical protein